MLVYNQAPDQYIIPPAPKHPLGEVSMLRPAIEAVELRHHGGETAVTLEGINLWFCYQMSVGGYQVETSPQDLSNSSIQFNIPKEKKGIAIENGRVKVILYSHFAKPIRPELVVNEKKVRNYIYIYIYLCTFQNSSLTYCFYLGL